MQGRLSAFTAAFIAAAVFGTFAASAAAQLKQDPIMNSTQPVASNVYFQQTAAQLDNLEANGERLVDFEPDGTDASGDTLFTVATVVPSGPAWEGFNFSSSPAPAGTALPSTDGSVRPFDLEYYLRNSSGDPTADPTPRAGYLGVENTGPFERKWRVLRRRTPGTLKDWVIKNKMRIIDLDSYRGGSASNALVIQNTGSIARKWWFYVNVTTSYINARAKEKKAAITDLEPLRNGRYSVVMERSSLRPYYRVNKTAAQIVDFAVQKNDRIADIDPEPDAPGKYSAVFIPNG
ncbi:MAG TPA: hypothetical protein VF517_14050 [Thermoleophilaceae bacterium]|jgi:hypothetical protein